MGDYFICQSQSPWFEAWLAFLSFALSLCISMKSHYNYFPQFQYFQHLKRFTHCGLINVLIIDPATTSNNCSIIEKFERKFRILNNISGKFFFFCCFKQVFWHQGIFFCLKSNNRLLLAVSEFASWLFVLIRYWDNFYFFYCST